LFTCVLTFALARATCLFTRAFAFFTTFRRFAGLAAALAFPATVPNADPTAVARFRSTLFSFFSNELKDVAILDLLFHTVVNEIFINATAF
jgi:hypothetical protein